MIDLQMLEAHDVIQGTDFVRQLSQTFVGQSDDLETTSMYGGGRINRVGWMLAAEVCPAFVGKTLGELNRGVDFANRHATEVTQYEIVRGEIPERHWEPGDPVIFPDLIPVQREVFGGHNGRNS